MTAFEFLVSLADETEKKIQKNMVRYFSEFFNVRSEVKSKCRNGRIDLIMTHKKDNQYNFGIEIKISGQKKGKDLGHWFKQAVRYQDYDWGCKLIMFVFPQISYLYLQEGELVSKHHVFRHDYMGAHNNVSTFLGANGIGELQVYDYKGSKYYRLVYRGKIFWDSRGDKLNAEAISKYL